MEKIQWVIRVLRFRRKYNIPVSMGLYILVNLILTMVCYAQESDTQQLLVAAKKGEMSIVQSLLDKNISPNTKDLDGATPLHLAAANGHQATAELLLKYGADINALNNKNQTPLDLAISTGHNGLTQFLRSKGAKGKNPATDISNKTDISTTATRSLKPTLLFKTIADFEKDIGEPAILLDTTNICFFVPKRREKEARIIFPYLVKAYDALYEMVGTHTNYKMVVYAFPKGNPHGWGGTSDCSIEYNDSNLELEKQSEWVQYQIPHVSGYIEEMAHNFVGATRAQFGWEMMGWSLGIKVSQKIAGNPILAKDILSTREGQVKTFNQYVKNGFIFPSDIESNQCDRIHAWLLYQAELKYGLNFWYDFFREIRNQKQALEDAGQLGDTDKIRNARYQITIGCFDKLPGFEFKKLLSQNGVSLTTDIKSLHPEKQGWNRKLKE